MYKVIIIDDEEWILESYKMGIDWNKYGFEVEGTAKNGMKGFDLIKEKKPDLVITDIRMPVMGGLELMEHTRKEFPDIEFVIISVYAEFAYAQMAISLGAAGYCLKPINELELAKVLSAAAEKIEKHKKRGSDSITAEQLAEGEITEETFSKLGVNWGAEKIRAVISTRSAQEESLKHALLSVPIGIKRRVSFVTETNLKKFVAGVNESTGSLIGISNGFDSFSQIETAIAQARYALQQVFFTGKQDVFEYTANDIRPACETADKIDAAFSEHDIAGFERGFDELAHHFETLKYNIQQVVYIYKKLCEIYEQAGWRPVAINGPYDMLDTFGDIREMIDYLKNQGKNLISQDISADYDEIENDTLREVVKYIDEHYAQHITLFDLSEKFYLNPNYLSRALKKEMGDTFTNYLTEIRLRHACYMLSGTDMQVCKVAQLCGYNDYFHFTKLFKRIKGTSPTEYRKQGLT